jgi:hypothetical protein
VRFSSLAPRRGTGASLVGTGIAGIDHTGAHNAGHFGTSFRSADCYDAIDNAATTGPLTTPKVGTLVTLVIDVGSPVQQIRVKVRIGELHSLNSDTPEKELGCFGPASR